MDEERTIEVVALVWLGVDDEREEYQPEILDALAQRRGAHLVGVTNGKPKP